MNAFALGQSAGSAIIERRKQRRFNEALAAGDVQQAGLIDPDRLAQQQALEAQRTQIQSSEDTLRRQATARAFSAAKNLSARTKDPLMAFDTVARISGKTFDPEEVAQARALVEEYGDGAFDLMLDSLSEPVEQKGPRFYSTGGGLYDVEAGQIIPGTGKPVAERDPLDDEYRRSQIEANRALTAQRAAAASKTAPALGPDEIVIDASKETKTRASFGLEAMQDATATLDALYKKGRRLDDTLRNKAASIAAAVPFDGGYAERVVGDDERDLAIQAANAYNNTVLPIISGQAVTESEAKRQVRSAIPQPGDSDATLEAKSRLRAAHRKIVEAIVSGQPINMKEVRDTSALTDKILGAEQAAADDDIDALINQYADK